MRKANILVAGKAWSMSEPLMGFTSHIEGRNAKVAIYEDHIEWARSSWHAPGGATAAVLTSGLSLALSGKRLYNVSMRSARSR